MNNLKPFQQDAVIGLVKTSLELWNINQPQKKLYCSAPSGAGKTIIIFHYVHQLLLHFTNQSTCFIWIVSNNNHFECIKSTFKKDIYFPTMNIVFFDDFILKEIEKNVVLVVNWEFIVSKNDNIQSNNYTNLTEIINKTIQYNSNIITILQDFPETFLRSEKIDNTDIFKTQHKLISNPVSIDIVLQHSHLILEISNNPLLNAQKGYTMNKKDILDAQLIKEDILLNPDLKSNQQQDKPLQTYLLEAAIQKRQELKDAYISSNKEYINPLLLIQLPNENNTFSNLDYRILEAMITALDDLGINIQNKKLAVWLPNQSDNMEHITDLDNQVDVLIFKLSLAEGLEFTRASVLLLFREYNNETINYSSLSKIMPMPEQIHYANPKLNKSYIYTDLSKNKIIIITNQSDNSIINKPTGSQSFQPLLLRIGSSHTKLITHKLSSKFKNCFFSVLEQFLGVTTKIALTGNSGIVAFNIQALKSRFIDIDITNLEIAIPIDVKLIYETGVIFVQKMERFAITQGELLHHFRQFCKNLVGSAFKLESTPVLELAIKLFFEEYLELNEYHAIKIVLHEQNRPIFITIIEKAIMKHESLIKLKNK